MGSSVATLPTLVFVFFNSSSPTSFHNAITLIVLSPLPVFCTVVIFPSSHRILYRVDGAEIRDTTATRLLLLIFSIFFLPYSGSGRNSEQGTANSTQLAKTFREGSQFKNQESK